MPPALSNAMKVLRSLAVLSFTAGLAMLVAGFFFTSGDGREAVQPDLPTSIAATPTPIPSPTATPQPGEPTPTPTPPPFDGAVARLKIPRFKVDSAVEDIGLLANNQLDTPHNPRNTGWYDIEGYGKPGFGGNSVFSAHVDYWPDILGPFKQLSKAELNDEIIVQMADGTEYHYRVIRRDQYPEDSIPMGDLIWPKEKPPDQEWITLITCGGEFVKTEPSGAGKYLSRDVVVAERFQ